MSRDTIEEMLAALEELSRDDSITGTETARWMKKQHALVNPRAYIIYSG